MNTIQIRKPAVAGQFYPDDPNQLKLELDVHFRKAVASKALPVRALIVPHAGYVFSGLVAASAYNQLDENGSYKNIFIIGASHRYSFEGACISIADYYETPLGKVKVNNALANKLIHSNPQFSQHKSAESLEHSLEVQLPFLQFKLTKDFQIVPILLGSNAPDAIHEIALALQPWFNNKNLFVISTDFSHYPNHQDAQAVDHKTLEAILSMDLEKLDQQLAHNKSQHIPGLLTSLCGASAVRVLLELAKGQARLKMQHLQYQNSSASAYGDSKRVVGYHSILLYEDAATETFTLLSHEKQELLQLARNAIQCKLLHQPANLPKPDANSPNLLMPCGAFVSLHKHGKLRGCIGRFSTSKPLYQTVYDMALAAAFDDTRFAPLKLDELEHLAIEISVLTPMQRIYDANELVLGRDGIYIKKGSRSGTFLPQVATNTGWTLEEFLGHCSADKAGLGWDGWRTAELYTYQALVFAETDAAEG